MPRLGGIFTIDQALANREAETGNGVSSSTPLEEALELSGYGKFHHRMVVIVGFMMFASIVVILVITYAIPFLDCDMNLTPRQKGILASMTFVGMMCASHLAGFLADSFGRRYVIIRCSLISAICCALAAVSPNYETLSSVWFVNGMAIAGIMTPCLVYVSEFAPIRYGPHSLLVASAITSLSSSYNPCVAWLILDFGLSPDWLKPWRLILLQAAIPLVLGAVLFSVFLSETPKYLLAQGKSDETLAVLTNIHSINSGGTGDYPVKAVRLDEELVGSHQESSSLKGLLVSMWTDTKMLFSRSLIACTLISSLLQFGMIGSYNGVLLWLPQMLTQLTSYGSDNATLCEVIGSFSEANSTETPDPESRCNMTIEPVVFISSILTGLIQCIVFLCTSPLTKRVGRKKLLVAMLLLASVACFLLTVLREMITIIVCIACIVVLSGAALPLGISIVVVYFPTQIRSMATSICMLVGRLGAVFFTQMIGFLQDSYCPLSFYSLAAVLLVLALLGLALPKTRT